MDQLSFEQLKKIDSHFEEDVAECFDYEKSVEMHSAAGGTARKSVLAQIEVLKKILQYWQESDPEEAERKVLWV